jgi:hypothetical protein
VKSQSETAFDFNLIRIENVLDKLHLSDFENRYILNYSLLDFLLEERGHSEKLDRMLNVLKDESLNSVKFIDGYREHGKSVGKLIELLAKKWPGFWLYIEEQSDYTAEKIGNYLRLIVGHVAIEDLLILAERSNLKEHISGLSDFLTIIEDQSRLKRVIESMNIKFGNLDLNDAPTALIDQVYMGNHYKINIVMLRLFVEKKGSLNEQAFNKCNYSAIKNSGCFELITYVDENISYYLRNVYSKLECAQEESEEYLIDLINNVEVAVELKKALIRQNKTIIEQLTEIKDIGICKLLLETRKAGNTWTNLIYYYQRCDYSFDEVMVNYLNDGYTVDELSTIEIDTEEPIPNIDVVERFLLSLLNAEQIEDKNYTLLLKSAPYHYENFDFEGLSSTKIESLIAHDIVLLTLENYQELKKIAGELHISLLTKYIATVTNFSPYELEETEVVKLLSNERIIIESKNVILKSTDKEMLRSSNLILGALGELWREDEGLSMDTALYIPIIKAVSSPKERVKLLTDKMKELKHEQITDILSSCPKPYPEITSKGNRPLLDDNELNRKLAEALKENKFISKFDIEKKGIRIYTFRNSR